MKLKRIKIKNFRGIKELEMHFGNITYLIGENNCGKTTILDAIKYCLNRAILRKGTFGEYDYHLSNRTAQPSTSNPIEITLYYYEDSDEQWDASISQKFVNVLQVDSDGYNRLIFRITSYYDSGLDDFVVNWDFLDLAGNPLSGSGKDQKYFNALLQINPVFYLAALRDAAQEFRAKSQFWGPFIKSVSITDEIREQLENDLSELNQRVLESHTSFESIKDHLDNIGKLVPLSANNSVSIEALPGRVFDLLSKTQVLLSTDSGVKLPINRHGEGSQSLAVLFLFGAFLKNQITKEYTNDASPILALEEPESHLHPSAVRSLVSYLSSMEGQKIVTTHSGDIISNIDLFSIRRLSRKDGLITMNYLKSNTLSSDQIDKITYHIRKQRGHLLFARCWIFVEGQTEFWILPEFAKLLNQDLDLFSVCCVEYRQFDIQPLIKLADDLGIYWHLLPDNDSQGVTDIAKARSLLGGRTESNHLTIFPAKDIEHYLWDCGFSSIYENSLSQQQINHISVQKTDPAYPSMVIKLATKIKSKPLLALEIIEEAKISNPVSIPDKIKTAIQEAILLSRRCQ